MDPPAVARIEGGAVDDHRVERRCLDRGLQAPPPRCSIVSGRKHEQGPVDQPRIEPFRDLAKRFGGGVVEGGSTGFIDAAIVATRDQIPGARPTATTDPGDAGRRPSSIVMHVSKAMKHADHRTETRDPAGRSGLAGHRKRSADPLVHAMANQPAAEDFIDGIASRGDSRLSVFGRLRGDRTSTCRIVLPRAGPIRFRGIPIRFGIRFESPLRQDPILAIQPATPTGKLVDRLLDSLDLGPA